MSARLNYFQAAPRAMEIMIEMEKYIKSCYRERKTLEQELIELIKIRVSQVNGCAYCLDMHIKDAVAIGLGTERISLVATWEHAHCFSDKEKNCLSMGRSNNCITGEWY